MPLQHLTQNIFLQYEHLYYQVLFVLPQNIFVIYLTSDGNKQVSDDSFTDEAKKILIEGMGLLKASPLNIVLSNETQSFLIKNYANIVFERNPMWLTSSVIAQNIDFILNDKNTKVLRLCAETLQRKLNNEN